MAESQVSSQEQEKLQHELGCRAARALPQSNCMQILFLIGSGSGLETLETLKTLNLEDQSEHADTRRGPTRELLTDHRYVRLGKAWRDPEGPLQVSRPFLGPPGAFIQSPVGSEHSARPAGRSHVADRGPRGSAARGSCLSCCHWCLLATNLSTAKGIMIVVHGPQTNTMYPS